MTQDTAYSPHRDEPFWYRAWEESQAFKADPQSSDQAFSILLPPPNVTGQLHMGHGFQQTLMDILIRHHRLQGQAVLWQPGTDHAGIATQLLVDKQLQQAGITKESLGRAGFIDKVMAWKNTSGQTITQQMRRLGASCDWSRECFTLDDQMNTIVNHVFVRLYQEGLIYRGVRLVNWDPVLQTAVSDLEVNNVEQEGQLVYIRYPIVGSTETLCVATTRPETLFGDTAVAVHPTDERWARYIGQHIQLPLTQRTIPIIADTEVDPAFGTGCVKITPAHDFHDYAIGQRHQLPHITLLDATGHLCGEAVPAAFRGLSVSAARSAVIAALSAQGRLERIQPHRHTVPMGERSGAIIEPRLTPQWFMDLTRQGRSIIVEPAIQLVEQGIIRFTPEHWTDTYYQWMQHIQDWCLSRQLWWGHQIPAWYTDDGTPIVACDELTAQRMAREAGLHDSPLTRDPDVLDTWFSSALWPFSTLGWTPEYPRVSNPFLDRYLPSSVLVTGFDIIFFWVSRMIMMTQYVTGQPAFKEVYVHGLIRDADGQKMSKSKGNILDPLDVVHGIGIDDLVAKRTQHLLLDKQKNKIIQQTQQEFPEGIPAYGADALRFTFASLASPGRDIQFDMQRCEGYRHFCHKLWHAARFVMMHLPEQHSPDLTTDHWHPADQWIAHRYQECCTRIDQHLRQYRFDLAADCLYHFIWDDWCAWSLEIAKIHLQDDAWHTPTQRALLTMLDAILHLAHPFIPFITEKIWQMLYEQTPRSSQFLMTSQRPLLTQAPSTPLQWMADCQQWVTQVRQLRIACQCKPTEWVTLEIKSTHPTADIMQWARYLTGLTRVRHCHHVDHLQADIHRTIDEATEIGIPIQRDYQAEIARCDVLYQKCTQDIEALERKLQNAAFIAKAPAAVVEQTQQLYHDKCAQRNALQAKRDLLIEKVSASE